MSPTWGEERIEHDARVRAGGCIAERNFTMSRDWEYVERLYENASIAAAAQLHDIAAQKLEAAKCRESNIQAVWNRVAEIDKGGAQ